MEDFIKIIDNRIYYFGKYGGLFEDITNDYLKFIFNN